jgi:hypothetical protein
METAGFTGKRLAQTLGWSESRMSRLLTGTLWATEVEVCAILALCKVIGSERDYVLSLTSYEPPFQWPEAKHHKVLQDNLRHTHTLTEFRTSAIPDLLQTEDYARALLTRSPNVAPADVEQRLAIVLASKTLLTRHQPPTCTFYIPECVLHIQVGDHTVMADQLDHVLLASVPRYVSIRIIPAASGVHARISESWHLMEYHNQPSLVYVHQEVVGRFVEEPTDVAAYHRILAVLNYAALAEEPSRYLISQAGTATHGCASRQPTSRP